MKVLIIGNFGYTNELFGGQTIKTRHIYELYKEKLGERNVLYFDVDALSKNKLLIFSLLSDLGKVTEIVVVPGKRVLKTIFPFIAKLNRVFEKKIWIFAVGGWLDEYIGENIKVLKHLKRVDAIFVESRTLKSSLKQKFHLKNVVAFPNFRMHDFSHVSINSPDVFRLVFMARVDVDKGILTLFRLMKYVQENPDKFSKKITLDIYGPIDNQFEPQFIAGLRELKNIHYKGVVELDMVFETLNQYDVTLLPTFYEGEGFPGTIIDSYIAGIPVIVSNWKNLPEFVDHGKSGFVYDLEDFDKLVDYVRFLANNDHELVLMKDGAKIKSLSYSADIAWKIIKAN